MPSLIEAWRTAPYLHDGRAATLRDVITTSDHAGIRGKTTELTETQTDDLITYLLSL